MSTVKITELSSKSLTTNISNTIFVGVDLPTGTTGNYSHAEGFSTQAVGSNSHAEGIETITGEKYYEKTYNKIS